MTTPKISVIIPIHNASGTLSRCIESIGQFAHSPQDIQVIAIDDGSTDNSHKCAETLISNVFHPSSVAIRQSNAGACAARNAGMAHSKGMWLVFLDADDFYNNDFLNHIAQLDNLDRVITANYQLYDGKSISKFQLDPAIDVLTRIAQGDFTIPGAIAIPRSIALQHPWDITLTADQDGEWLGRIAFSGIPIEFEPEIGIVYSLENQQSISKNKSLASLKSRSKSAEKILELIEANPEYNQYKKAIAKRMDLISFSYFWSSPKMCIQLRKRARRLEPNFKHNIKGKQGLLRNVLGFYPAQLVIGLFTI